MKQNFYKNYSVNANWKVSPSKRTIYHNYWSSFLYSYIVLIQTCCLNLSTYIAFSMNKFQNIV